MYIQIPTLSAYAGSSVEIDANIVVGGSLLVQDTSRINIQKNVFKIYRMQVDSTAHVSLPGSMLRGPVAMSNR